MEFLDKKLDIEEQSEILGRLFGFSIYDEGDENKPHYVIYDEEGHEFYGFSENEKFNLDNIIGIFNYAKHVYKELGYRNAQFDFQKIIGLK